MRLKSLNRNSGMTTIMTGIAISQKLAQDCEHLLAGRYSRRYSHEFAVLLHRPHGIEVHTLNHGGWVSAALLNGATIGYARNIRSGASAAGR